MTVYFIGAGPGAPDLITVRGLKRVQTCGLCLYAGSLVPKQIIDAVPKGIEVLDTAPMVLDEIIEHIKNADAQGLDVARVHSGDPSIYGAIAEQMRRLDMLGMEYEIIPGVPAFAGAAAQLKLELTLPEIAQTVIVTRTSMRASAMPEREKLEILGQSGATLAIHLSIRNLGYIYRALQPYYGADCPVIIAYRATWPDELYLTTTLQQMRDVVRAHKITRTALIFVGPVLGVQGGAQATADSLYDSALYSAHHAHILRNKGKKKIGKQP